MKNPSKDPLPPKADQVAEKPAPKKKVAKNQPAKKQAAKKRGGSRERLPAYLSSLDKRELVELVLDLLPGDKVRQQELALQADLAADKLTAPALKKRLTAAIPYNRYLHRYPQVRSYFQQLETTLETLRPFLVKLPPERTLQLLDYALQRIARALETIDDSGGFRLPTLELLGDLHIDALGRVEWPGARRIEYLFGIYSQPLGDLYPPIPEAYRDALGDAGMDAYLAMVQQQWDALPPLQGDEWEMESHYMHLASPLLEHAREQQDSASEIAILTKLANRFYDYLQLSELCLDAGELEQALHWRRLAEQAPQRPQQGELALEDNQISIWCHTGDFATAEAMLWERFSETPDFDTYLAIEQLPRQRRGGDRQTKAVQLLHFKIEAPSADQREKLNTIGTLAHLYLHMQQPLLALEVADNSAMEPYLLLAVLEANDIEEPRVLPLYFQLADFWVNRGDRESYREAIRILQSLRNLMPDDMRSLFVAGLIDLLDSYPRKRNFCKWLNEAFGDLLDGE
ncbi:MAG: hypothetical protein GYB33_01470 [Gammaproteobacteria bacterium]|uniref:hypothetical protein n=1 Tax=Pseudomaricurvus alcaniphilus TaxID=1166482 RepID=UPI00140AC8BA|nr:hypothetical protein [Pseudomaricurvus alcaniphilus]MBR9909003.1 hypothetical protein [Gammaproteobacteria bacterium]NHN38054.1 hypothetical protein [Pseudomaricurvus alcaniphilus]